MGNAGNFGTGSTDYVQVPTLTSAQSNMTVAVWIDWLGTFDVNTRQDFVSFTPGGEDAGGGIRLFVWQNNFYFDNNAALGGDRSPAAGKGVWTAQAMNNNTWVLLVGVVDGANWTLYQYWSSCSIIKAPTAMAYSGATFNNCGTSVRHIAAFAAAMLGLYLLGFLVAIATARVLTPEQRQKVIDFANSVKDETCATSTTFFGVEVALPDSWCSPG